MLAWRWLGRCARHPASCAEWLSRVTACSAAMPLVAAAPSWQQRSCHSGLARSLHEHQAASRQPTGTLPLWAQPLAGVRHFADAPPPPAPPPAPKPDVEASIISTSGNGDELADSNIIVTAYHIGTELDMTAAASEHRGGPQHFESDHCIMWVPELKDSTDIFQPGNKSVTLPRRCLVLFPFGSVVFFGFAPGETELWLKLLHQYVTGPLDRAQYRREELKLEVRPQQVDWIHKGLDVIQLKRLNMATTRILSLVLAQSVALDTYMSKVDQALARTVGILEDLTRESVKQRVQRQGLMNLLCQNNLLYTTVITKLGVLDYSPLAWRQDRYYDVWKVLTEEYEITHRVNALERKVGPIQENVKFLLQLEHTKKTERSELIIIYLIFIEIVLTCVHIFSDSLYSHLTSMLGH